jgi:ADP-ribose pyrophosphatase YjhB (NUDIX family)
MPKLPAIVKVIPPGDDKERDQCTECKRIMYRNPLPVGGVVVGDVCPESGERRVLLLKRAIEPRSGFWTHPGGFLENDESTMDGAVREAKEEACADVKATSMLAVQSVPAVNQILIWFRAEFSTPAPASGAPDERFRAGHETLDARLFRVSEVPWDELAFPTTRLALQAYLDNPEGTEAQYQTVLETVGRS